MHTDCCCSCVSPFCRFLLLFVIVCRMAKFAADSLNLIPVLSFSSFKRDTLFMYHLAVLLCCIYGLDLPASSVITGMRGAKANVNTPRRSPLVII